VPRWSRCRATTGCACFVDRSLKARPKLQRDQTPPAPVVAGDLRPVGRHPAGHRTRRRPDQGSDGPSRSSAGCRTGSACSREVRGSLPRQQTLEALRRLGATTLLTEARTCVYFFRRLAVFRGAGSPWTRPRAGRQRPGTAWAEHAAVLDPAGLPGRQVARRRRGQLRRHGRRATNRLLETIRAFAGLATGRAPGETGLARDRRHLRHLRSHRREAAETGAGGGHSPRSFRHYAAERDN